MKTGKLNINATQTYKSYSDENSHIPVTFLGKENFGGKLLPQDKGSTRSEELSLMNNSYFGAIHYDIHLDLKLDCIISKIYQEMSLSELEARTNTNLQALALAVLKIPYAGYLLSGNRLKVID